jgi:hypothetical protein
MDMDMEMDQDMDMDTYKGMDMDTNMDMDMDTNMDRIFCNWSLLHNYMCNNTIIIRYLRITTLCCYA